MGLQISTGFGRWFEPELYPYEKENPTFDPNYGFSNGRKEREPPISYEQMVSAKVPEEFRDYCAHYYIDFKKCLLKSVPFGYRCNHEKHHFEECQQNEMISRMKEYEREKRLLQRAHRKKLQGAVDNVEVLED
ncbi:NADH dehydrogenase [ubiquinone] 1 beta subcomplex subunit 7-like [Mizuhopecten yessoensis]|uniref:NADH dehydrogenase [ubiquinone] 1 beta subcomplex subunit 7 n=1 Tax=Mizuhopecten yessoensis TaxID=6573 RepID=A0A210PWF8_MIZYE|nr:NADH dehydrogenase [ubiquinone] 1 beta subcomplex subunit 7-like [Mizuhopecten yessoensis]OWF40828.1 NADH dehydrogenase [ubiquinone] 1 beta subcomplex subunit 7 [Mizuhopecten yessoensis]